MASQHRHVDQFRAGVNVNVTGHIGWLPLTQWGGLKGYRGAGISESHNRGQKFRTGHAAIASMSLIYQKTEFYFFGDLNV
jgi:hypothetical protein